MRSRKRGDERDPEPNTGHPPYEEPLSEEPCAGEPLMEAVKGQPPEPEGSADQQVLGVKARPLRASRSAYEERERDTSSDLQQASCKIQKMSKLHILQFFNLLKKI